MNLAIKWADFSNVMLLVLGPYLHDNTCIRPRVNGAV